MHSELAGATEGEVAVFKVDEGAALSGKVDVGAGAG